MRLALHQPELFSYAGYWNKMFHADVMVIYDDVQFNCDNYQHRMLLECGGQPKWFSLPYDKDDKKALIQDVRLHNKGWQLEFKEKLFQYYHKSEHYDEVIKYLTPLLEFQYAKLADLVMDSIMLLKKLFHIDTPIIKSSVLKYGPTYTRRNQKIINIMKCFPEAQQYLSGTGAYTYMSQAKHQWDVEQYEIIFRYIKNNKARSKTRREGLSIIDTMMNYGIEETERLIKEMDIEMRSYDEHKEKSK